MPTQAEKKSPTLTGQIPDCCGNESPEISQWQSPARSSNRMKPGGAGLNFSLPVSHILGSGKLTATQLFAASSAAHAFYLFFN